MRSSFGKKMKIIIHIATIFLTCWQLTAEQVEAPEKDLPKEFSMGMTQDDIPGTTLWRSDTSITDTETKRTEHRCYVGILREGTIDGKQQRQIVPVLTLPPLENDTYDITVSSGTLTVTTTKTKRKIVALNLASIAPAVLTEIEAEQAAPSNR